MKLSRDVYVVGGKRTPFVKSMTSYKDISTQDLMIMSLNALVEKFKLEGKLIGDVGLGAIMNRSSGWNLARESVLGTKLDPRTPAYNVARACGTSLEAANQIALKISAGQIEVGIAGGVDTNSDLPVEISRGTSLKLLGLAQAKSVGDKLKAITQFKPSDIKLVFPAVVEPRTGKSMGQHTELMVQEFKLTQKEQDEFAVKSHHKAAKAYQEGFYDEFLVPTNGIKKDAFTRGDTTVEKMSKLKPAFDFSGKGTLTAGNSTPLTDGSAAVLLSSKEYAEKNNLPMLAKFVDAEATAVDFVKGDGLLMAPTQAVANLLKRNNLNFDDFDFIEIHEAFAGQVLCTLKAWESEDYCKTKLGLEKALGSIKEERLNIKGSSLAVGHPFAATGARIIAQLAKLLSGKKKSRGLISICTAGGMGVAAIMESVD